MKSIHEEKERENGYENNKKYQPNMAFSPIRLYQVWRFSRSSLGHPDKQRLSAYLSIEIETKSGNEESYSFF